jgi:hypothetical protein
MFGGSWVSGGMGFAVVGGRQRRAGSTRRDRPVLGGSCRLGEGRRCSGKSLTEPGAERAIIDCKRTWSSRSAPFRDHRICWHAIDKYLRGQAAWLVNYAKRYRASLRVGTS